MKLRRLEVIGDAIHRYRMGSGLGVLGKFDNVLGFLSGECKRRQAQISSCGLPRASKACMWVGELYKMKGHFSSANMNSAY